MIEFGTCEPSSIGYVESPAMDSWKPDPEWFGHRTVYPAYQPLVSGSRAGLGSVVVTAKDKAGSKRTESPVLPSGSSGEFDHPCEARFEHLAENDPEGLFAWVRSGGLSPGDLTHAAEACGRVRGRQAEALEVLTGLLEDPSALVREGAVYGLQRLGRLPPVQSRLLRMTMPQFEKSAGVRAAARDALEDLVERG